MAKISIIPKMDNSIKSVARLVNFRDFRQLTNIITIRYFFCSQFYDVWTKQCIFTIFSKIKAIEPKNPHIIYELYRARSGGFFYPSFFCSAGGWKGHSCLNAMQNKKRKRSQAVKYIVTPISVMSDLYREESGRRINMSRQDK